MLEHDQQQQQKSFHRHLTYPLTHKQTACPFGRTTKEHGQVACTFDLFLVVALSAVILCLPLLYCGYQRWCANSACCRQRGRRDRRLHKASKYDVTRRRTEAKGRKRSKVGKSDKKRATVTPTTPTGANPAPSPQKGFVSHPDTMLVESSHIPHVHQGDHVQGMSGIRAAVRWVSGRKNNPRKVSTNAAPVAAATAAALHDVSVTVEHSGDDDGGRQYLSASSDDGRNEPRVFESEEENMEEEGELILARFADLDDEIEKTQQQLRVYESDEVEEEEGAQ